MCHSPSELTGTNGAKSTRTPHPILHLHDGYVAHHGHLVLHVPRRPAAPRSFSDKRAGSTEAGPRCWCVSHAGCSIRYPAVTGLEGRRIGFVTYRWPHYDRYIYGLDSWGIRHMWHTAASAKQRVNRSTRGGSRVSIFACSDKASPLTAIIVPVRGRSECAQHRQLKSHLFVCKPLRSAHLSLRRLSAGAQGVR